MEGVNAAWACDDAGAEDAASLCRLRAIGLFHDEIGEGGGVLEPDDLPAEEALMADLNRRAGRFAEALEHCRQGFEFAPVDFLRHTLEYEGILIGASDVAAHTLAEVVSR